MKKLLLLAMSALTVGGMQARTLSAEQALARVSGGASGATRVQAMVSPKLVATGTYKGLTTYYVYSSEKSAMILSASDITAPVVGYLDRPVEAGTQMPPQLVAWLDKFGKCLQIAETNEPAKIKKNGAVALPFANVKGVQAHFGDSRKAPAKATRQDISPLLKTTWDQGAPYNNLCPSGTYTGCVATAIAQAMKYYNYPDMGTGYVSTKYNNQTLSMNLGSTPLAWSDMLDSYPSANSGTEAQRTAVATLMKAVGYSVKMSYGKDASGALSLAVPSALVNNFKYDNAAEVVTRAYYEDEVWSQMIYDELAAGRPVLYSGSGEGGGHEFVCDGYKADNGYFHFNWGWSGAYDGFFSMDNMVPEGQGAGGNQGGFNDGQDALIGFQKPVAGSKKPESFFGLSEGNLQGSANGRVVTLTSSREGLFLNMGSYLANFDIGFALRSSSGSVTNYTWYSNQSIQPGHGVAEFECNIPTSVADGTYEIYPVYRLNGASTWVPVRIPVGTPEYVTITISGNTIECTNHGVEPVDEKWTFSNLSLSAIPLEAGTPFTLYSDVTNNTSEAGSMNLVAVIANANYNILNTDFENFITKVTLNPGETTELGLNGNVPANIPAGNYLVAIMDADQYMLLAGGQVAVTSDAVDYSKLKISSFKTNPATLEAGKDFVATIKYTNTGDKLENFPVDLILACDDLNNENNLLIVGVCGSTNATFNKSGIARSLSLNGKVGEEVAAGQYYLVLAHENSIIDYIDVTVVNNNSGGVEDIIADDNADYRYFDLQGRPVDARNAAPGLYIRRSGAKAEKVIIK